MSSHPEIPDNGSDYKQEQEKNGTQRSCQSYTTGEKIYRKYELLGENICLWALRPGSICTATENG